MTVRQTTTIALQALCWGASYIFLAAALKGFTPIQIVAGRSVLAAAMLAAVARVQGHALRSVIDEVYRRPASAAALTLSSCLAPYLLIAFGQRVVPAGLTGVLIASIPLWTALLALRLDAAERIDARQGAGLLLGLVGVALVVGVRGVGTVGQLLGIAAILVSAGSYALSAFVVKRHYAEVPPTTRGLLVLSLSSSVLVPLGVGMGGVHLEVGPTTDLVLLAGVSTALGMLLLYRLIDDIGPRRAVLTSYLAPVFSLLLAALVLGEPVTGSAIAGLVLIVGGVAIASGTRRGRLPVRPRRLAADAG